MKPARVLLISNSRPSRSRNFANRITREVPGTEICGIVQRPVEAIPAIQRLITRCETQEPSISPRWSSKMRRLLRSIGERLVDLLFWFIHGCVIDPNHPSKFTMENLREECARAGWPLVVAPEFDVRDVINSICGSDVGLVILLGEFPSSMGLVADPPSDCIRACNHEVRLGEEQDSCGVQICIEHATKGSKTTYTLASLALRTQPLDGPLGLTLKTDLIADDLLLQTAANLLAEDQTTSSAAVTHWAERILAPCLGQFNRRTNGQAHNSPGNGRCRSTWKLCLDTLLLCSPWILARNWYRRARRSYPVLILAHHLVSDRPHRMGMATEAFWRQVLYLKKHYRIVSLSQACELLRSGEVRVPTVALTFDDGYADNFLSLRAVANEAGIPCTLFITTNPVDAHREFDHDLRKGTTGFLPLTWDQIQFWSRQGVEFGSHTRTHFNCGSPDLNNLQSEIVGSKSDLERRLGVPVKLFAFPYGKRENMSGEAMQVAASAYSYFVSSFGGEALTSNKEPQYHLFRKRLYESRWELELELQSVFDLVDTMKRLFHRRASPPTSGPAQMQTPPSLTASLQGIGVQQTPTTMCSRTKDS